MKEKFNEYIHKDHSFDKPTMLGIICLIIVISGVFGFLYEYIFYYFNGGMQKFYWRGGNFSPWINIYAVGAVGIFWLTYRHRKSFWKVFLMSSILCGLLEFFSGLGMYIIGDGFRCWDYNTEILNFGNIGGFICLRSVLFFGLSSLLLIYIIVPFCFHLARVMTKKKFLTIAILLCSIIVLDEIYNLLIARMFHFPRASDIYKELGFHYMNFKQ